MEAMAPLGHVVAFVDVRTHTGEQQSRVFERTLEQLGATVLKALSIKKATHVIWKVLWLLPPAARFGRARAGRCACSGGLCAGVLYRDSRLGVVGQGASRQ